MKELVNFSLYENDMNLFDSDWGKIRNFLVRHDLDGLELFVDYSPLPEIPGDMVEGVHLPYWMGRHRAWADDSAFSEKKMSDLEKLYFFGGASRADVIDNFRLSLDNATVLNASYGVFHVSYAEFEHVFTGQFGCTDHDVFKTTADFLNEAVSVYPRGEPPIRLFFENLWWPGLTFLDPVNAEDFVSMLDFENWAFTLDTGHLMNATTGCNNENDAIDLILNLLSAHPEDFIRRIEGMHLHCSLSGDYVRELKEAVVPEGFSSFSFNEKFRCAMEVVDRIDEHRPFTSSRCREIVEFAKPSFLTHEFTFSDLRSLDDKLNIQKGAFKS